MSPAAQMPGAARSSSSTTTPRSIVRPARSARPRRGLHADAHHDELGGEHAAVVERDARRR